ncbi:SgcJ/EcaC family oxidoreductase [Nocardia sp. NPDC050710]|uniref:SgcJ/EcaC family oxidoreductase n=1 Tax=Nocardia sp. NPDC050710 TaxID=3157220 RepID=UPI0033C1AB43
MGERTEGEIRIGELIGRATQAWADNDAAAYAAEFAEDSDYVAFDGTLLRGRKANRELHAGLFDGVLFGTRLEGEIESIRFVTDDIAVVHGTGAVVFAWQREASKGRRSRNTWVLHRTAGGWEVTAFHNTRVRPVPSGGLIVDLFSRYVRWRTDRARAN